jgi:hypothetical protein
MAVNTILLALTRNGFSEEWCELLDRIISVYISYHYKWKSVMETRVGTGSYFLHLTSTESLHPKNSDLCSRHHENLKHHSEQGIVLVT